MKVTISVAIYNVASFIEECVRSLYEQTLDDIEILLIDDCTPDDSIEIALRVLEEYPNRKSQVRVFRHEHNLGIAATKTDGYKEALGDYVVVIDGDDYVDRRFAELLYGKAIAEDADLAICDFFRKRKTSCRHDTLVPNGVIGNGDNVRADIINRRVPPFLTCKLVRRSVMMDNDVVWPVKGLAEDTVISVTMAYYATRIAHVAEPLYYYRMHQQSVSHVADEASILKNYDSSFSNVEITLQFLRREKALSQYGYGAVIHKLRTKNRLLPIVDKRKYRKLWLRTYPEINKVIFFGNKDYKATYRERIWFICIVTGLYPKFKKKLHSPKYRVPLEWL